jgi:hypothetical protein
MGVHSGDVSGHRIGRVWPIRFLGECTSRSSFLRQTYYQAANKETQDNSEHEYIYIPQLAHVILS